MAAFPLQKQWDGQRYTSRGPEVLILQKWLNRTRKAAWPVIAEDGIFGPETEAAAIRATGSPLISETYYQNQVMGWYARNQVNQTPSGGRAGKVLLVTGLIIAGVWGLAALDA